MVEGDEWATINHQLPLHALFPTPLFRWPFLPLQAGKEFQTLNSSLPTTIFRFYKGDLSPNSLRYLICSPKNRKWNICFNSLWQKIRKFPEKEVKVFAGVSLRNHQVTQVVNSQHPLKTLSWPKRMLTSAVSQSSLCSLLSAYASKLNF